ncbi:MAG: FHA domain-containing protein [Nitrospirae bacterium]|nr:FHA domain-containing protein [Nitrospirota bacterium]
MRYTIGRDKNSDIVLADESVSRVHAEVTVADDGKIFISDSNSRNGTTLFRDGKPLSVTSPQQMFPADKLKFGDINISAREILQVIRAKTADNPPADPTIIRKPANIQHHHAGNEDDMKVCPACAVCVFYLYVEWALTVVIVRIAGLISNKSDDFKDFGLHLPDVFYRGGQGYNRIFSDKKRYPL